MKPARAALLTAADLVGAWALMAVVASLICK